MIHEYKVGDKVRIVEQRTGQDAKNSIQVVAAIKNSVFINYGNGMVHAAGVKVRSGWWYHLTDIEPVEHPDGCVVMPKRGEAERACEFCGQPVHLNCRWCVDCDTIYQLYTVNPLSRPSPLADLPGPVIDSARGEHKRKRDRIPRSRGMATWLMRKWGR